MSTSALRAAIHQQIEKNPETVINVLKSAGQRLTFEDESAIANGWLERFSDAQILELFNQTVLGKLGIHGEFIESSRFFS